MRIPLLLSALAMACSLLPSITVYANPLADALLEFQQTWAQGKAMHVLDIDNDSLLMKREDGFYTSGLRYTMQALVTETGQARAAGWRIGHDMYTALDIKVKPEQLGALDHPYAAWLYIGAFQETQRADGTSIKFGVDLGCLGPCAGGERVQTNLHRIIHQPLPQGWSSQVKTEVGAVLYAQGALARWTLGRYLDLTPSAQGRFGNIFTDASLGATLRFGRLNNLPGQDTLHGFMRIDARAVGYDASLQGGYFSKNNPHTVKPKPWVGEAELGVAWRGDGLGLSASIIRRGNGVRDLSNAIGAQNFARLQFVYVP